MDRVAVKQRLQHEGIWWSSNFDLSAGKTRGKIAAPTTFGFAEVGANYVSTARVRVAVKRRPPHKGAEPAHANSAPARVRVAVKRRPQHKEL